MKRVYESDDWIVDEIDGCLRISYFKDNHFVDEVMLKPAAFENGSVDKIKNDDKLWRNFV